MKKATGLVLSMSLLAPLLAPVSADAATPASGVWSASYYNNETLAGKAAATKVISHVEGAAGLLENAGTGAPAAKVNSDHYSARYVTKKKLPAGTYDLRVRADDGARVYLDDKLVFDGWMAKKSDQTISVANLANGSDGHTVRVEYREGTGASSVAVTLEPAGVLYRVSAMDKNGTALQQLEPTYEQAVQTAQQTGANAVVKDGQTLWIPVNGGVAYVQSVTAPLFSKRGITDTGTMYYLGSAAKGSELRVQAVDGDWVKVSVGDTIGWVQKSQVKLVPAQAANVSYYKAQSGQLYFYESLNGVYQSRTLVGKAPGFMQEGVAYDSPNGHTFAGQEAYQYFQYASLHTETSYTAAQLEQYVKQKRIASGKTTPSPLESLGQAFKNAEQTYHVNAMMLLSIAILESNYGFSKYVASHKNLFNIGAFDGAVSGMQSFPTLEDCINTMAGKYVGIDAGYSNRVDWRYRGAYVGNKSVGMNVFYATDIHWGQKIAGIMYDMDVALGKKDMNKYEIIRLAQSKANVRGVPSLAGEVLYQVQNPSVLTRVSTVTAGGREYSQVLSDTAKGTVDKTANGTPLVYVSNYDLDGTVLFAPLSTVK